MGKRVFPSFLQKTLDYSSILYVDLFIMNGMIFYIDGNQMKSLHTFYPISN